jgi:ribonuclease P protein component
MGGAVQRNQAKRLLRAAITPLIPKIIPGNDILLLARKPIIEAKSTQVKAALEGNLRKANLLTYDDKS